MQNSMPRSRSTRSPWSAADTDVLIAMTNDSQTASAIARRLPGRTEAAVEIRIFKMRKLGLITRPLRVIAAKGQGAGRKQQKSHLDALFRRAVRLGATNDWLMQYFRCGHNTIQVWKGRLDLKGYSGTRLAPAAKVTVRQCCRCRKPFDAKDFLFLCDACKDSKEWRHSIDYEARVAGVRIRG